MKDTQFNHQLHPSVQSLVKDIATHPHVEAILLAGSRTAGNDDPLSDYDLYVYTLQEVPLDFREQLSRKYFLQAELNNTFWEPEDIGIFREIDLQVDLIYRDVQWIEQMLHRVVVKHEASTGYTTCFWANLLTSVVLFDRNGILSTMQKRYDVEYPEPLQRNIILKNFPILSHTLCSYTRAVETAKKRHDIISIHHRFAGFLASYFDVLFAINKKLHPGEKKLLKIASQQLQFTPRNMVADITEILTYMIAPGYPLAEKFNGLSNELKKLLCELEVQNNLLPEKLE